MNRHVLFHSNGWDLDLVISRSGEGNIGLYGQIMPGDATDATAMLNAVAVLAQEEQFLQKATISPRGEFEFRNVPDSKLQIELFLNSQRLTASFRP
jgi:hypothetical protein